MIHEKDYYGKSDIPGNFQKRKLWKNISREVFKNNPVEVNYVDWKSFSFGLAAAVIVFFAAVGIYTVINTITENQKPQIVQLTEAYRSTVAKLENILPERINKDQIVNIDEKILPKKEKLVFVNEAINELQNEYNKNDYSKLKLERLYALYKMKLEILEEIIAMEEI
jgi:hypothetical protein